jgi:hypothetical protein
MYDPLAGMTEAECYVYANAAILTAAITGPPKQLARDEENGIEISTIHAMEGWFETAICMHVGIDYNVCPVERYETEAGAVAGHAAWVEAISNGVDTITDIGYGALTKPKEIRLEAHSGKA